MKSKIVKSVLIVVIALSVCLFFYQDVSPRQNTNLALETVNETNDNDRVQMRYLNRLSNNIDFIAIGLASVGLLFVWKKNIKK